MVINIKIHLLAIALMWISVIIAIHFLLPNTETDLRKRLDRIENNMMAMNELVLVLADRQLIRRGSEKS